MDPKLRDFLETQRTQGLALAAASDLLELVPLDGPPTRRWVARFRCAGLVETETGTIVEGDDFWAGITFREDHLRAVDPRMLVTWLRPRLWHPNVLGPLVCLGHTGVGISLVEIVYQLHAIVTYTKATLDDALNPAAAAWAREQAHRFPVDRRPLKRLDAPAPVGAPDAVDFVVAEVAP